MKTRFLLFLAYETKYYEKVLEGLLIYYSRKTTNTIEENIVKILSEEKQRTSKYEIAITNTISMSVPMGFCYYEEIDEIFHKLTINKKIKLLICVDTLQNHASLYKGNQNYSKRLIKQKYSNHINTLYEKKTNETLVFDELILEDLRFCKEFYG